MAISGTAVAAATAGAFLVYAGIKDVDSIQGLRDILAGKAPVGKIQVPTAAFGVGTSLGISAGNVATGGGAAAGGIAGQLIAAARSKLGAPYVWTAVGPDKFDCSGLVIWSLRQIKFNNGNVPRFVTQTFALWARSQGFLKVDEKNIQAGDIVLKSGHMGIAISNTEMIHAPHTGSYVKIGKIYTPRYMWSGWRMPGAYVASTVKATNG